MSVKAEDVRFAGTLIDGARMYAAAADAVNDKLPNALHVLSHLLGMSAELALKSYLKHNNVPTSELRKLGHELIVDVFEKVKGKEAIEQLKEQPGLVIRSVYPEDTDPSSWAVL